jgi:hypothetical protein
VKRQLLFLLLAFLLTALLFDSVGIFAVDRLNEAPTTLTMEELNIRSFQLSMEWNKYHNYSEITSFLQELNATYPDIVDVFSIGKSWQNREIYCIRLTNESLRRPKPAVLIVGRPHAREPITTELALYFADYVARNFRHNMTISRMLNYSEVYVVPVLNVDGAEAVRQNHWQRKNARQIDEDGDGRLDEDPPEDADHDGMVEYIWDYRNGLIRGWEGWDNDGDGVSGEDWVGGVDLNRNYGYEWNASTQSGSVNPEDEDYKGPALFSEPETRAMRDLIMQYDFRYAASLHSGADVILYPWGYTILQTSDDTKFRHLAGNMSALVGSPYEQSSQMYTTSGVWDDWVYGNQSAYAFTFEIYNNDSAWVYEAGPFPFTTWVGGILQAFNPPASKITDTIEKWMPALFYTVGRALGEFLPGDVNHDSTVNMLDVVAITSIYGSRLGDAAWNPKRDLMRDGQINILDVVIVTGNYGRTIS